MAVKMKWFVCIWLCVFLTLNILTEARVIQESDVERVQKRSLPYWNYSANDFWHYVEYFRSIGAYDRIQEMAHTFYAHFPIEETLGYEAPDPPQTPEKPVKKPEKKPEEKKPVEEKPVEEKPVENE
uniref:Otospiralin n=1 Tax=Callorhinchus milii TaxID=7868 RepID=A0A4W3J8N6_CALMI|eukprot:gi/632935123/ref/XP_007887930.1/ PREDICTED: otospiralin [Callorhinchus milii]